MKNVRGWQPSKIQYDSKTGLAKPLGIGIGSRFSMSLQTPIYRKKITVHAAGHLLDCGAGQLPYYPIYKNQVDQIYAIDWGKSPHDKKHLDKVADLNKKIPYADDMFDTVLLADVLEHIHDPLQLMREISRVLKKGGKLICFVPFMYWVHEDPHDYHRYTRFMLEKLCRDNKLKVLELKPYGGGPDVLLDALNKLSGRSRWLAKPAYYFSTFLSKRGFYKRLKSKTQQKMPLGYSLVAQKKAG